MITQEIIDLINTELEDNTSKKITPAILRNVLKKVTQSIHFIPYGELLVFEPAGKATPGVLTTGDYCQGYVEGEFINANYLGGDKTLLASYDIQ